MNKNEYRRAFIMLRAVEPGYGGHVRLEARVLSGSLYFIVTAPEGAGELTALLAGQRNGVYAATPLGTLRRDRRGQLTLARHIDPRDIGGRPLDAYQWVVIATGERGEIVLTGNVNGSRPMDPVALARAVRDRLDTRDGAPRVRAGIPASDLPEPGEILPSPQPVAPAQTSQAAELRETREAAPASAVPAGADVPLTPGRPSTPGIEAATAPIVPEDASHQRQVADATEAGNPTSLIPVSETAGAAEPEDSSDVKIYTISRSRLFAARAAQVKGASGANPAPDAPSEPSRTASGDRPEESSPTAAASLAPAEPLPAHSDDTHATDTCPTIFAEAVPAGASPAIFTVAVPAEPSPAAPQASIAVSAAEAPAPPPVRTAARVLGMDITRPWPGCLEPLRRLFATQAPLEDAPDGEHVYVRATMPEKSGFDACLVGLRTEGGAPVSLRYALPARRSPEPPPGLDGYRWLGDGESGWWVTDTNDF